MVTRTTLGASIAPKTSFSLKAEVLLLLIITIFGIIGLSFCISLYGDGNDISAELSNDPNIELTVYDQQTKT